MTKWTDEEIELLKKEFPNNSNKDSEDGKIILEINEKI